MDRKLSRKPAVIVGLIAIVLAVVVALVALAGKEGGMPEPTPTIAATPKPTPSVASSHLGFQRNDDGGFTADFVIHANGQLEARQIGVGYPNWEYVVGPRVSIRMTDDEGRLHFTPKLTCPNPERQASMPEVAYPITDSTESGRFDAVLSVEQDGGKIRVKLELTGNAPDRRDDRYVMVWGGEACDARTDDPTIRPDFEAQLREMLPDTLEGTSPAPTSRAELSCPAGLTANDPSGGLLTLPAVEPQPLAVWNVLIVDAALPSETSEWTQLPSGPARAMLDGSLRQGLALTEHAAQGNLEIDASSSAFPVVVSQWKEVTIDGRRLTLPNTAPIAKQLSFAGRLDSVDLVIMLVPTYHPLRVGYSGVFIGNPSGFPDGTELIVLPVKERVGNHTTVLIHELLHFAHFRLREAREAGSFGESGMRVETDAHTAHCYGYEGDGFGGDWNAWYAAQLSGAELGRLPDGTRMVGITSAAWAGIGSHSRTRAAPTTATNSSTLAAN